MALIHPAFGFCRIKSCKNRMKCIVVHWIGTLYCVWANFGILYILECHGTITLCSAIRWQWLMYWLDPGRHVWLSPQWTAFFSAFVSTLKPCWRKCSRCSPNWMNIWKNTRSTIEMCMWHGNCRKSYVFMPRLSSKLQSSKICVHLHSKFHFRFIFP